MFPVYCRYCRAQIAVGARNCQRCGKTQGLQPSPPPPSVAQPPRPASNAGFPAAATVPPGTAACPYCKVSITPGDYFCRACGRALAAGVGNPARAAAAAAYGTAGLLSVLLCFPPGGVIFGIVALAKGARGLGVASILAGAGTLAVMALLYAAALGRVLSAIPGFAPLRDLAP